MKDTGLPTVSVILPVRNGANFLEESLGSIVGQVYRPIEILVFDNASTDATPEIANSFCGVRYFRNDPDLSSGASRNIGIDVSKGELIAFASHDDLWAPEKLWIQAERFQRDPELEFCLAHVRYFLDDDATSVPAGFPQSLTERDLPGWLTETLIVRRSTFQRVGYFDENLRLAEGSDWLSRAQDLGARWAMPQETLVRKRIHGGNVAYREETDARRHEEKKGIHY
jgi:glycosyltransferase involved in cell wall biosynthesis